MYVSLHIFLKINKFLKKCLNKHEYLDSFHFYLTNKREFYYIPVHAIIQIMDIYDRFGSYHFLRIPAWKSTFVGKIPVMLKLNLQSMIQTFVLVHH